jgi:hypothetical protein
MTEGVEEAGFALFVFRPNGLNGMQAIIIFEKIFREAFSRSG